MACLTNDEYSTSGIDSKDAIARQSQRVSIIHLTRRADIIFCLHGSLAAFVAIYLTTLPHAANIRSQTVFGLAALHTRPYQRFGCEPTALFGIPTPKPRQAPTAAANTHLPTSPTLDLQHDRQASSKPMGASTHDVAILL